jgi:hypothetical protein
MRHWIKSGYLVPQPKQWTVVTVNFRSTDYLGSQLKLLYEFNDPQEFTLLLYDNSRPHEREALEALTAPYQAAHQNIEIVYYTPASEAASAQHGEALTDALAKVNTPYLLVHDPDFFWVQRGYLKTLQGYLEKGNVAIGAPYNRPVGIGNPLFPAAYGCAYSVENLKKPDIDFTANISQAWLEQSQREYPDCNFSYDVGWKIRRDLSALPFVTFKDEMAVELIAIMGSHSFASFPHEYFLEGKTIAFHLFRGTITDIVDIFFDVSTRNPNVILDKDKKEARQRYAAFFYSIVKNPGNTISTRQRLFWRRLIMPAFWKILRDQTRSKIQKPFKAGLLLARYAAKAAAVLYRNKMNNRNVLNAQFSPPASPPP